MQSKSILQRALFTDKDFPVRNIPAAPQMSDSTQRAIQRIADSLKDFLQSAGNIQDFIKSVERLFAAAVLDDRYQTTAALSAVLSQTSTYGKSFADLILYRCAELGYASPSVIRGAMPWQNAQFVPTSTASRFNDPGLREVLLSYVTGMNAKEEAIKRLVDSNAAPLTPNADVLEWLNARLQDLYTAGMFSPHSDMDIPLIAIRSRLSDSKHELSQLVLQQLAAYQSSAATFTMDGFIHHFQLACAPQLNAWSPPEAAPPGHCL